METRYRIVLELSLLGGEFGSLDAQLTSAIQADPDLADVKVREITSISPHTDDYSDWRYHRGAWDLSSRTASITFEPKEK